MSHVPSRRPPRNACKMCENMSWNNLVFLYMCRLKSPVCSQAEHERVTSASGISHSLVTLPQLSLPPVKGHGVSGPAEGQVWQAGVFLPAASWCVVWFVLSGMWLYETQRAICWCYGFNSFLFSYCSVLLVRLAESIKHTSLKLQNKLSLLPLLYVETSSWIYFTLCHC